MRRWLIPRSALGGAGRGALLALAPSLLVFATSPGGRSYGCCCWNRWRWEHLSWHVRDGALPGLLLLAAGVGAALGAALAVRPPAARGGSTAGRALALAGVHAAGLLGPLASLMLDDRRWITASIRAVSPLSPSDPAAWLMFVGSLGAALLLAFALLGLRRPAAPLGTRARLGVAACGLSVAFFGLPSVVGWPW